MLSIANLPAVSNLYAAGSDYKYVGRERILHRQPQKPHTKPVLSPLPDADVWKEEIDALLPLEVLQDMRRGDKASVQSTMLRDKLAS